MPKNRENKTKKIAFYGVFVTLALIASYVESLVPISVGISGVKLGLANLITMLVLYCMGWKDARIITCIRIVFSGFLFGNLFAITYSFEGAILSFIVILILKKLDFGMVAVSAMGGVFHNVGQILYAAILVENIRLFYYLPVLLLSGILAGLVIGILGGHMIKRVLPMFQ